MAVGVAGVLVLGCVMDRPSARNHGARPVAADAGLPMVFSARVVGDKRPDFYSLKTLLASQPFQGLHGADLARAWITYFASAQDGCTYSGFISDRAGALPESGRTADPLRMLNAHGWLMEDDPNSIWVPRGHTMDFALRPGESLIRSQRCEGLFPGPAHELANARRVKGSNEPHESGAACRTCGNGRWIYEPNLRHDYLDFAAGVRNRHGLTQTAEGLIGAGQCTIPFFTPYPFVSRTDRVAAGAPVCRDGARITLCASGDVTLEISDAYGTWTPVPVQATRAEETIDISPLLEARCAFEMRLTLGTNARVTKFRFEGLLLTAPMTIPRLDEGLNVMTLKTKDQYGLATVPYEMHADFRRDAPVPLDQQAVIRNGRVLPRKEMWRQIVPKDEGTVRTTFRFDAPAGETFAWFYVLASVACETTNQAPHVTLDWGDTNGRFRPVAETVDHTLLRYGVARVDAEQMMDQPGPTAQVRVTSDVPIIGLDFVGHLDRGAALAIRPEITHRWLEGAEERQFRVPPEADRYYFRCGPGPTGHLMEMRLPSIMIPVVNATVRGLL
ncbi:MAG: hypothetical protein ACOYOU_17380 [Kiritimatiellia bacterium]